MAQRYQVADDSPLTADEAAMGCEKWPLESVLMCFWVCVFLSLSWQIESSFLSDNLMKGQGVAVFCWQG